MAGAVNSAMGRRVEPGICRSRATLVWCAWATTLCLGVHGCTEATGGAVELSWALRSTRDRGIGDCAGDAIGRIRLWWETEESRRFTAFPCRDNHGVTAFDLPVGEVALSVTPECADGNTPDPELFTAPPPIVRDVAIGEAITLDAVLLVVKIDDCASATCVCGRPCVCDQPSLGASLATEPRTKHPDSAIRGDQK
jgi:hypothetical protein